MGLWRTSPKWLQIKPPSRESFMIQSLLHKMVHRCQNHYKREFQMIGKSFSQLGQAMEGDGGNYNPGLNNAVIATGNLLFPFFKFPNWAPKTIYNDVQQGNATRKLVVYTRSSPGWTGSTWPTWCTITRACWLAGLKSCTYTLYVLPTLSTSRNVWCFSCQGAQGKRKEVDGENTATAAGVRKRGDAVSYSLLAEVSNFGHLTHSELEFKCRWTHSMSRGWRTSNPPTKSFFRSRSNFTKRYKRKIFTAVILIACVTDHRKAAGDPEDVWSVLEQETTWWTEVSLSNWSFSPQQK